MSQDFERAKADFDQTKSGVKGILDSGVSKIPSIFIHPPESLQKYPCHGTSSLDLQVPVIDLNDLEGGKEVKVGQIREASEQWGIFQLVNHGIPVSVLDEMLEGGVRGFHEQPSEVKMKWYSRAYEQQVRFYSNGVLYEAHPICWRDSISCHYADGELDPNALPPVSRRAIQNYMEKILNLKVTLAGLLSEALGLNPNYLESIDCMKTATLVCQYYPPCPEPDLTLGVPRHSDPSFITILLQDSLGGLQVLKGSQWVDVKPIKGAIIVNIGDHLQLMSNDKFKSVEHRVLAAPVGPRLSAACFFYPRTANYSKPYGPIKELVSEEAGPVYREVAHNEYMSCYRFKGGANGNSALPFFKL
ncbi:1-aminocyclopropane-1-carboxylate oxidase homolog 1-like [Bidens hawaiensis]|uniref:1-aminocyclopropane-1-carboxylate oxidase homolog 1-like n=1 Tax=Bidens hawaiensis TaxID=980011 RepID=UPI00404928BA